MKKKLIAAFIVTLVALTMTVTLVACSKKEKEVPSHELVEVEVEEFVDFIVDSAMNSFAAEDGKYFSMDSRLVYEWKNGDQIEKYYLNIAFTLDLDPDRDTFDNQMMIELKKFVDGGAAQTLLGLHYVEQIEDYDYSPLFLTVGEYKFQYKASSLKNLLQGGDLDLGIGAPNQDAVSAAKDILGLGLLMMFKDFKVNGDRDKASMAFNTENVLELVKSFLSSNNRYGELDEFFAQIGLNLTVEQLMAIEAKFDILVNFEVEEGHLEDVYVTMNIHEDQYIHIENLDGKDIINIKLAKGTVSITVDSLRIFGEKGFVYLPEDVDSYKIIGLVNLDVSAKVNFYREDGTINNGAASTAPIEVWLKADINPFVLLNGITADNLSELGVLHIRAANDKGVLFEIVFDPKNTGTNSLYATFASMQTALIKQDLTFEAEATVKILQDLLGGQVATDAEGGEEGGGILEQILAGIKIGATDREDGGKNLLVTMDIVALRKAVDSLLPGGVDILGTKLYLSNIVLGDGNVKASMEFTGFKYGQLDGASYDATALMNKGSSSFVKQVLAVNGEAHRTEYTQGEALQYAVGSGLSLKVELLNGKTSGALQPFNAKVMKVEGFDPNVLGEQKVTLYLRDNSLFASIIAGAVASDFELPLGVTTYTYTVNVIPQA